MVDISSLLETHAQVALAVAGFASVIAALGKSFTPPMQARFNQMLSNSFIQVIACLLPGWLRYFIHSDSMIWLISSAVFLSLITVQVWWLVWPPMRDVDMTIGFVINRKVTTLVWGVATLASILLLMNIFGAISAPDFPLYYSALLCALIIAFSLFADVVIGKTRATEDAS